MNAVSLAASVLALAVSATTAWLTLFRRGTVRMTQPTLIYFGSDKPRLGQQPPPKIFLRRQPRLPLSFRRPHVRRGFFVGRYKALFFRTLGYDQTSWQELEGRLRSLLARPAEPLESTEYGTKYAIIAPLTGLNGRMAEIVTVWIILAGEETPRFVTAYPKD